MLKKEDIDHLATLARIKVSEEEKEELAGKLDQVLSYVSEIGKVSTDADVKSELGDLRNVMRPDGNPHPGGEYTEKILANAPETEDGFFKVRRIM